jgi:rhodanese-related sulfurtransferase
VGSGKADHDPHRVPKIEDDGTLSIDPWWGVIQPASLHPDIPTIGELEVIEHLARGGAAVDTRRPEYVTESGTIPGAEAIRWEEIDQHAEQFETGVTVLFCNGPQCAATPRAVERLLAAGVSPERLAYYRGGLQDWMGLGLPVADPDSSRG